MLERFGGHCEARVCCATQSRRSLDRASPRACNLDFNYVGEDPSYNGDNVVYIVSEPQAYAA